MPQIIIIDTRKPQETKSVLLAPENQLNQECLLGRDERCCIILDDTLGEVVYDDDVDCEDGFVYTCVARPVGRVVIEV